MSVARSDKSATGRLIEGGIDTRTQQVFDNLTAVLEATR
jgi:hypothetical protein